MLQTDEQSTESANSAGIEAIVAQAFEATDNDVFVSLRLALQALGPQILAGTTTNFSNTRIIHSHHEGEVLHNNNSTTWQSIYECLQQDKPSVDEFYMQCAGKDKHFEATPNDEAHTTLAADISKQAAVIFRDYIPQERADLLVAIDSLIAKVKAISDSSLRRKVKFAVDRLLRDNENDVASNFNGRQLLISAWQYLRTLKGGPNSAELQTFWLGLQSYIDSGDYPTATMGDVSTKAHFEIGVFAGDTEVSSDAGLHPACYGRMRNISSSILAIHHAAENKHRMVEDNVSSFAKQGKAVGIKRRTYTQQALSMLKILNQNKEYLPDELRSKMIEAFDCGLFEVKDNEVFVEWFKNYNPSFDTNMLQTSLAAVCGLEELMLQKKLYADNEEHQNFFKDVKQALQLQTNITTFFNNSLEAAPAPIIT